MESADDLPEGVEDAERPDEHTHTVCDADGFVLTVRDGTRRRLRPPAANRAGPPARLP